jgi:predicted DNA-binding transcriptional regulator AlpA
VRKPLSSSEAAAEVSRSASPTLPRKHHLDRRASDLAEIGAGAPDDLLSTRAVAEWLGVSVQFLEIGRHRGYGPKFVRIGPARIRYRRADVLAWLEERTFASTSQYGEVA